MTHQLGTTRSTETWPLYIDEEIFKPLYTTENDGYRVGRPNVSIRILVAMIILKEGIDCCDEQLYEHCRFNLLYRRALDMVSFDDQCSTIDSYDGFRRKLCKHEEMFKENLFDKCFKQITKQQAKDYRILGKSLRMDSKLIFLSNTRSLTMVLFLYVTREKSLPRVYRILTIPMQGIVERTSRE